VREVASKVSLTSLTVCKNANIVAIQGRCDQLGHILEDACLLNLRPKDSVKVKGLQSQVTSTLSLGHGQLSHQADVFSAQICAEYSVITHVRQLNNGSIFSIDVCHVS